MRARSIVVDASIAKASGERGEIAIACARVLATFRRSDHTVVTSRRLRAEWNRHASRLANTWLVDMVSRGRFVEVDAHEGETDDDALAAAAAAHDAALDAMRKDLLLIEAALAADKRILSLDEKARRAFGRASGSVMAFRQILWANPSRAEDLVDAWLRDGARRESARELRNHVG
ncbi:MAG: hypothetical protein ABJE95_26410 [Byssovorax sp.]